MTNDENEEDEWELNTFVITAKDLGFNEDGNPNLSNNQNLLLMHGMGQDAETWLTGYFVGKPLPLKLADKGYRVFMGNNRGTKFSAKNFQESDRTSEAYWNFDFTDFGT